MNGKLSILIIASVILPPSGFSQSESGIQHKNTIGGAVVNTYRQVVEDCGPSGDGSDCAYRLQFQSEAYPRIDLRHSEEKTTIQGNLDVLGNNAAFFLRPTVGEPGVGGTAIRIHGSEGSKIHMDTEDAFGAAGAGELELNAFLVTVKGDLSLTGTLTAETVETNKWKIASVSGAPDYVFDRGFELMPLREVERFIEENKHLPEIPGANAMEKDGLEMVDMSMRLLKKLEELTLHAIRQEKDIASYQDKLARQEERLARQQSRLENLERALKKLGGIGE